MTKWTEPYREVILESYRESGSGLHGDVHIRPVRGDIQIRVLKDLEQCIPYRHSV
jgi:hypothetical protein